ncbi:MAG: hypothetical protein KGO81_01550 [Bacteroidota bacterium]|nr:hypothetical protein [Bacteroidota bacterium]
MKQLAAILLLAILLFNWVGYRLVTDYFENSAETALQAQLDQDNYSESQLVSIKVPFSVPYGANSVNFEKVNGSIEVNGVKYQYVKRRFYKDSLEVLCIPNMATTSIKNARDEFFKMANDFVNLNTSKKATGSHSHTVKFSVQDYTNDHLHYSDRLSFAFVSDKIMIQDAKLPDNLFVLSSEQPPEMA